MYVLAAKRKKINLFFFFPLSSSDRKKKAGAYTMAIDILSNGEIVE